MLIRVQVIGHNYGLPLDGISEHLMQFERGWHRRTHGIRTLQWCCHWSSTQLECNSFELLCSVLNFAWRCFIKPQAPKSVYVRKPFSVPQNHYVPSVYAACITSAFRKLKSVVNRNIKPQIETELMTVAARSTTRNIFARSNAWTVGSNPTQGMDACPRLFCVCIVLCR
jgi:hypothetical protein